MEVMEEGNLLDRVSILLQRDGDYYEQHQSVLQEAICSGIAGNFYFNICLLELRNDNLF